MSEYLPFRRARPVWSADDQLIHRASPVISPSQQLAF
jgi:hypothetical protein